MGLIPYKHEEYLDWSDESNVMAMRAALEDVGRRLGKSHPLGTPYDPRRPVVPARPFVGVEDDPTGRF